MHTSDEGKRKRMMHDYPALMSFIEISQFGEEWVSAMPALVRRKVNLSFVLMEDNEIDLKKIRKIFDPNYFAIRLAIYLPNTRETAERHPASTEERMAEKAEEAKTTGFDCIESRPGNIEQIWNTRPWSAFTMLRNTE
ncbi:MAG: hypothetical protein KJ574_03610 [Nanoarchaeota archaeon]|nr:hypothetical protein [Nanoarchaeota archaeon]